MNWAIRDEQEGDAEAMFAMVQRAFDGHPYSDGDEGHAINRLRDDGDLLVSLVVEDADEIIGQIAFSRANLSNGEEGWMVLGPIAIEPSRQGGGIGRALMAEGEARMRALGAKGITVLGNPKIYSRFGYVQHTPMTLEGELGEYLQVKSFGAEIPAATLTFAKAFAPGG